MFRNIGNYRIFVIASKIFSNVRAILSLVALYLTLANFWRFVWRTVFVRWLKHRAHIASVRLRKSTDDRWKLAYTSHMCVRWRRRRGWQKLYFFKLVVFHVWISSVQKFSVYFSRRKKSKCKNSANFHQMSKIRKLNETISITRAKPFLNEPPVTSGYFLDCW